MRRRGEITVFLAMILVSICALLCGIAESARTAGARCFLRMAMDSSMDSLMAQYHRELWDRYRILGLEFTDREMLEGEIKQFLQPYIEAQNWYPMDIRSAELSDMVLLTEGEGHYLEQEILDYMKYGLVGAVWDEMDESEVGELSGNLKEADSVGTVSGFYDGHTREAVRLEKALEDIGEKLEQQKEGWDSGRECLADLDGEGFIRNGERMIRYLEKLPGLVDIYEERAEQLNGRLQESRRKFEEQQDLSTQIRSALEDEICQYEAYTAEDGQRRREVQGLRQRSGENIEFIRQVMEEAREVMDYIDSWEPEDEDDELDEEALWSPVISRWERYPMLDLGIRFGVQDKEKEGFLERVRGMAGNGLLELVLPEGAAVSGRRLKLEEAPSFGRDEARGGLCEENLLNRLIICEYGIRYFDCFDKLRSEEGGYELEYLLWGRENEKNNLSDTISRLVAVREGLNLIHIFSDTDKRQEARALAMTIAGGTGILPLVSVITFFIMAVWALGEAIMDVRRLLNGERVPFFKTDSDWRLSLEGLLSLGKNGRFVGEERTDVSAAGRTAGRDTEKGMNYRGYLRILLFGAYGSQKVYRMMDMMQYNICQNQPGFRIEKCACTVDMKGTVGGKHVFFSPGLWKNQEENGGFSYETEMSVSGSYLGGL
ncbi:MAG: DUF5702 domain-containing protein [Enterocloster sp.]